MNDSSAWPDDTPAGIGRAGRVCLESCLGIAQSDACDFRRPRSVGATGFLPSGTPLARSYLRCPSFLASIGTIASARTLSTLIGSHVLMLR